MAPIALVIDSSASITPERSNAIPFVTVPQTVTIQSIPHSDWQSPTDSFYQSLTKNPEWYKTSAANPDSYLQAYKTASRLANQILCITPSPKLSAAYNSAKIAKKQFKQLMGPTTDIRVINSESGGPGMSVLVPYLSEIIDSDAEITDVEQKLLQVIRQLRFIAVVPSLRHLRNSGRVPWIAAVAARAVNAKFVIELSGNRTKLLAITKHMTTALERLIKEIHLSRLDSLSLKIPATIMNANNIDASEFLLNEFAARSNPLDIINFNVSAAVATHVGPGFIGTAFFDSTIRK